MLRRMSIVFLLLLLTISPSISHSKRDVENLLKLKSAFNETESDDVVFATWNYTNSACQFTGIKCDSDENVAEINLGSQRLVSTDVPFDSICDLKFLKKLVLGNNSLRGKIGENLRNCTRLTYLDLGINNFSGEFPAIESLNLLKFLSLNASGISGKFPWNSLKNLKRLSFLSIGDNRFDPSPFPDQIPTLTELKWLYLSNSSITGKIPEEIKNLIHLQNLELSDNQLSGEIPKGIIHLQNLRQLELYSNNFTGKLPTGFGNLTNLRNFDASNNSLEGDLSEVRFLNNLVSLGMFENRLTGEIPKEFGDFKRLSALSLYRNKLIGKLPEKLGSWTNFKYIDVSENFLEGQIPPDMCKNGSLTHFLILQNRFTGQIPESYVNCKSLIRIRVSNNSLSGMIPSGIWGLPNLQFLDLALNSFEGSLSDDIGQAKSLGSIDLSNNRFSGVIPSLISGATSLVSVNFGMNKFSGQVPDSFVELKELRSLSLDGNNLSGDILESLGSCQSLTSLNLGLNSLSGTIPESLGSLRLLNSLNLSGNKLSGTIPVSLSSLKLSLLDLSNNELTGSVPESLKSGSFQGNSRLCSSEIKYLQPCPLNRTKHLSKFYIALVIAAPLSLVISLSYVIFKIRQENSNQKDKNQDWKMNSFRLLKVTGKEIINAIKPENLIAKGGHGNVYKVTLENGTNLAVKHIQRPDISSDHISFDYFEAEVATLSNIKHINVVKLFCSVTNEDSKLLVYEFLANGSLWEQLHERSHEEEEVMRWSVRYVIALGAAKGLEYLHNGLEGPVVHRDLKSSNILLDEEWNPRIADFGLAKMMKSGLVRGDLSDEFVAGTLGYIAPENAYWTEVNEKSDVYSFGVVLMELVTGKKPIEAEFGEHRSIVMWVLSKREKMIELIDPKLEDEDKEDALKVLRIALLCTNKSPQFRPLMRSVVIMLEKAKPLFNNGEENNVHNDDITEVL